VAPVSKEPFGANSPFEDEPDEPQPAAAHTAAAATSAEAARCDPSGEERTNRARIVFLERQPTTGAELARKLTEPRGARKGIRCERVDLDLA
jgi:hypothetical protein